MVERFNRTLVNILVTMLEPEKGTRKSGTSTFPLVTAYRSTVREKKPQRDTEYASCAWSPHVQKDVHTSGCQILFGREVTLPIDIMCPRAARHQNGVRSNRWCPANVRRSLKIAAEPAVIEQTPAVLLHGENVLFSSQRSRAGSVLDM